MALALTAALTFGPVATDVMGERWIPAEYLDDIGKEAHHTDGRSSYPRPDIAAPPPTLTELVAAYFPPWAVADALKVISCESQGDPWARNRSSGASGLFQQMPRYWPARSTAAGWPGASIFDPEANVAVSAWLWGQTGTWTHWSCKP